MGGARISQLVIPNTYSGEDQPGYDSETGAEIAESYSPFHTTPVLSNTANLAHLFIHMEAAFHLVCVCA